MPSIPENGGELRVAGVALSQPDRVLFAGQGVSARQLARYYTAIADHMLPWLADRPLVVLRLHPGENRCVLQALRQAPVDVAAAETAAPCPGVHDLAGLIALLPLGALEIHTGGASPGAPELTDRLLLDLDPGGASRWSDLIHAARWLHGRLAHLALQSFVRTTGARGLHVVVPLQPAVEWRAAEAFSLALARQLAGDDPMRFAVDSGTANRADKILLGCRRNVPGAVSIANYSSRARPGAPVAAPLLWSELADIDASDQFTIASLPGRARSLLRDPWEGYWSTRQTLNPRHLEAVKGHP